MPEVLPNHQIETTGPFLVRATNNLRLTMADHGVAASVNLICSSSSSSFPLEKRPSLPTSLPYLVFSARARNSQLYKHSTKQKERKERSAT